MARIDIHKYIEENKKEFYAKLHREQREALLKLGRFNNAFCRCGRESEFLVGSRDFFIFDRKITVNKLPHFYCERCDNASFSSITNVNEVVKKTYKENLNEIDYV